MIENVNRDTYVVARKQALMEAKEVYTQLENREIKYKNYKTKVKNIMRKYISKLENDQILSVLSYIDKDDKRYYVQTFFGDFRFNHIIDINLVNLKYEDVNSIEEIPKSGFPDNLLIKNIHNGNVENFSV
jgi:ribosomal protein S20